MSFRLFAAAGLLLVGLAGCKPSANVSPSFSFEKQGQGEAVILVGLRHDPAAMNAYTRLALIFQPYDPQTDTLSAGRSFNIVTQRCRTASCDNVPPTRYYMLHVPAGDYVLKAIATVNDRSLVKTVKATSLVGVNTSRGMFGTTTTSLPTRGAVGNGLRYRLGASEVVYLGEFVIDAVAFPAVIREIDRVDTRAERVRRGYPRIATAPWVFRQPNDAAGHPMQVRNYVGRVSVDPIDQTISAAPPGSESLSDGGIPLEETTR